jgi:hypothetical protein
MPTHPEMVAHVEASLRQRFFPLVPRMEHPNRAGWTEETHDQDRLSRALAAYAVATLAGISDARAAGAVIDGPDDGGIDAVHFDRAANRLLVVQSKFKPTGTAPSQAENLKTVRGVEALFSRRFGGFNERFQERLDEIEEALDTPGVTLRLVLAFLGDQLGPHVVADLEALRGDLNSFAEKMEWTAWGVSAVYAALLAEQVPVRVSVEVVLENWAGVTAPRRAVYGQISAASLADLVQAHGTALFERNIRHYLGSVGVNAAIERCVRNTPREFFYLNNGITAVAERIDPALGTPARCGFRLTNVSIVNGAQTAGAITSAALDGDIDANAKLLITIVEVGAGGTELGVRITRARNHQTAVRGIDFAALDPMQERLRKELALLGITYHYRPSEEARIRRDDACTLEEAALALACSRHPLLSALEMERLRDRGRAPVNVAELMVAAKAGPGRLWEQEGELYGKLFDGALSGVRVYRSVLLYRFVDAALAAREKAEERYPRRMFYRHARYFVCALVAHRSRAILERVHRDFSGEEQTSLSRATDMLVELAFEVAESWRIDRGYLSFFRTQTDVQQLADTVLSRLSLEDAARAGRGAGLEARGSPA